MLDCADGAGGGHSVSAGAGATAGSRRRGGERSGRGRGRSGHGRRGLVSLCCNEVDRARGGLVVPGVRSGRRRLGRRRNRRGHIGHLGPRRRRVDRATEVREIALDRGAHAVAVAARVRLERVGVGLQASAARDELRDLGLEATPLTLVDATGGDFGLADEGLGLRLGLVEDLARALLRFGDRVVGGALRKQQRALDRVGVVAAHLGERCLGSLARRRLLDLAREILDGDGRSLEQVVDLVAVVPTKRLFDLAPAELLRCYVHETCLHRSVCHRSCACMVATTVDRTTVPRAEARGLTEPVRSGGG